MKTFQQWLEATSFSDRYHQLYNDDKPMPGKTYEYYLKLFTKLAHKQGRELTKDELKALERHKLNDIQAST